jgi:hypothetical protein
VDVWSSTGATIIFDDPSCSVAYITAVGSGSAALGVAITGGTLAGGSISNTSQTINYNTVPTQISASVATGGTCSSYSYQWYSSPNNSTYTSISGATGQNYQPGSLTATTYYKRLTTCGSSTAYTTNIAVVSVYSQLVAGSISPSSQTINYNTTPGTLTLSGVSGGNSSYTYQWQSSSDNSTWTNISGATSTGYSPGSLTATTYYRVVVTSNGVTAYSATAVVTVYPQLVGGSISPSGQTINYNTVPGTLTLSGVSGGNGSYTYQWQSSPDNSTWTNISGATSTGYSPGSLTATTYYRVVVTSNGVTAYSATAVVTVYPQLVAGSISPSSQTINYNTTPGTLTLSGVSGGNSSYTYQWQSSPDNGTWTNISGATSTGYSPGSLVATTYYRVVVTSNGVTAYSATAVVTVYPQLAAGSISPSSQTINYNTVPGTLTLSGVSGGSGSYTYQWQSSPDNSTWTNISGATSTGYSPGSATSTLYYRVVVTSNGVTAYSATAVVTVYAQLVAGSISPSSQTINYNTVPGTLTLSGVSSGSGSYTYQWQSSLDNSTWTNISGATSTGYSPGSATSTLYYRVVVTSNGASAYSATAVVNVIPQLLGGTISGNTGPLSFNTSPGLLSSSQYATGGACSGSYTYQWQYSVDGTNYRTIAGATATTYMPVNLSVSTYFRRQVSCGSGLAYSNALYIQVTPQRAATCTTP